MKSLTIRFDIRSPQKSGPRVIVPISIYTNNVGENIYWKQLGKPDARIPVSGWCDANASDAVLYSEKKQFAQLEGFKVPHVSPEPKPPLQGRVSTFPNPKFQLAEDAGRWTLTGNSWHVGKSD